jgi:AcrR family transcriptional regulator
MVLAKRHDISDRLPEGRPRASSEARAQRSARGELARAKLKAATARVLERVGYRQMRVADVTREAGVAAGLFHHYFPDLKTVTIEVLRDFMARFEDLEAIERDVEKGDWFARSLAHNRVVVGSYARSPGIMRCMVQVGDEEPEFGEIWRASYYRQLELLVRAMPRLFPAARLSSAEARLVTRMLAGIGEQLLTEYYILKVPAVRELELDEEQMAEWLAVMFHRALFLENPPPARLRHAAKLAEMRRGRQAAVAEARDREVKRP